MALEQRGAKGIWYVRKMVAGVPINRTTKTSNRTVAEQLEAKWTSEVHAEVIVKDKQPIKLHKIMAEFINSRSHLPSADNCRIRLAPFSVIKDQFLHVVSEREAQNVVESMFAKGNKRSTVAASVAYWNGLLNYAEKKGYSIAKRLERVKGVKGKVRFLTIEEEQKLLATIHPAQNYSGKNASRDAMRQHNWDFICLLVDTGARHGEIADMQWNQVDFTASTVTVHRQKGGNDTVLYMTDRMKEILVRRRAATSSNNVMVRPANEQNWLDGAIERAGLSCIPSKPTLHTLRHTFAERFLKGRGGLHELQHLLGHVDIGSTLIYSHFAQSDAAKQAADIMNKVQTDKPAAAPLLRVV